MRVKGDEMKEEIYARRVPEPMDLMEIFVDKINLQERIAEMESICRDAYTESASMRLYRNDYSSGKAASVGLGNNNDKLQETMSNFLLLLTNTVVTLRIIEQRFKETDEEIASKY